jgi:membrane-bound inhibitor of C-type lysozyme
MVRDKRIRIAAGVLAAVLSVLGSAQVHAAPASTVRYACDERQNLVVERDGKTARVHFVDRSYDLRRKASGIGVKYESANAALIIDGASAIFVTDDRLQLGACTEAIAVASLR